MGGGSPEYHAEYWQQWYPKNAMARKARANLIHAANAEKLKSVKEASPCKDCGRYFPSVCMDFDHVGTDKFKDVSSLMSRKWEFILLEINKCELVCSNCHRIRTEQRRLAGTVTAMSAKHS